MTATLLLSALPSLVGRCIQTVHYASLPEEQKGVPKISYMGMSLEGLPLQATPIYQDQIFYHWTKSSGSINREGFIIPPNGNAFRGAGVYASEDPYASSGYGCCRVEISLDIKSEEVCEVKECGTRKWDRWEWAQRNKFKLYLQNKKIPRNNALFKVALKNLFLVNGFKAQRYNWSGKAICVYDPQSIKIQKIFKASKKNHTNCID